MESSPETRPNPAAGQMAGLRLVLTMALTGVLLGFIGVDIQILQQLKLVRTQLRQNRDNLRNFNERDEPVLRALVTRLGEFVRKNPDFKPIYDAHVNAIARVQNEPVRASETEAVGPAPVGPAGGTGLPR